MRQPCHIRRPYSPQLSTGEPTYVNRRAHVRGTKKTFSLQRIFSLYAKDLLREQDNK